MTAKFKTGLYAVLVDNSNGSSEVWYRVNNDSDVSLVYIITSTHPTDGPTGGGWNTSFGIGNANSLDVIVPGGGYLAVGVQTANPQPIIHGTYELLQELC